MVVWVWPVRLSHWLLVASVICAWLWDEASLRQHVWAGYVALGSVVARCGWGIAGRGYARFDQFVRAPREVRRYAACVMRGDEARYVGHNPLGGWMAISLLVLVSAVCITGVLYTTDAFWGVGWLEWLHRTLAWALVALIGLHVCGVVFTSRRHRENLVSSMLSGRKAAPRDGDVA